MVKKEKPSNVVPADPAQWGEKSKRSVAFQFNFVREYKDIAYKCWRCQTPSIFTAEDQKYTYEEKRPISTGVEYCVRRAGNRRTR